MEDVETKVEHTTVNSSQNDSTGAPQSGKEKVSKTFLDTDFFADAKIQFLIAKFGAAGPTYYLRVALAILSEGGRVHSDIAGLFVEQLGTSADNAKAFLDACIRIGLLYQDGDFYGSARADREISALTDKRSKWREDKQKERASSKAPKRSKKTPHGVRLDTTKTQKESEYEYEEEKEGEKEQEVNRKGKPGKSEVAPGVWLSAAESEKWIELHGKAFFDRCCEKLSAWIEQDPTPKRKRNGLNAAATFRVWVVNAVAQEQASATRLQGRSTKAGEVAANGFSAAHNYNMELLRRAEEEERDQG